MLFPVMKLLVSIWMGSCYIFKGQSLGYPVYFRLYSCCSVTQLCLTLCNSMDCSTPGFPILHYFLEFAQTYVRWVNDAIQPSHPLSSPSSPAVNISQYQGLFQWVEFSHQVAKVWEKVMAPHSSTLAWKIPWMEEPGRLQSMGSLRVGHNWMSSLSLFHFMHWRRK